MIDPSIESIVCTTKCPGKAPVSNFRKTNGEVERKSFNLRKISVSKAERKFSFNSSHYFRFATSEIAYSWPLLLNESTVTSTAPSEYVYY